MTRDLGDFQTPPALVAAILDYLGPVGRSWSRVLEPTCGQGNFIAGLLGSAAAPREILGIELQNMHVESAQHIAERASSGRVVVRQANIFDLDLQQDLQWRETGPLLVVGNPPWVTTSDLGALESDNRPHKANLKNLRGIDALTGGSNFDIAEYIWLKLIRELAAERPTIALLCKTSVARNVLQFTSDRYLPVKHAEIRRINAKKWFGVAIDACLFRIEIGQGERASSAAVYRDLAATKPDSTIAVVDGQLIADNEGFRRSAIVSGACPVTWRQGLKHDAASVMELTCDVSGHLRNKLGESVVVEPDYVYPLLKGSDLFHLSTTAPGRMVIVTQKRLGEDTRVLARIARQLWAYLRQPLLSRAAGELERLGIQTGAPESAWPSAIEELLVDGLPEGGSPRQMTFL